MIQPKRYLDENESNEEKTKKLRTIFDEKKIISCFENLPNELYHEIFDYFDGYYLYKAFLNLNIRFQNLLTCSSRLLKINVGSSSEQIVFDQSHIATSNKHQILSLKLIKYGDYDRTFPLFTIDSSFIRLESLALESIKSNELIPFLVGLLSLPCLLSLTIDSGDEIEDISNLYQIIFNLPMLKNYKLSFASFETYIPLSIATNNQFSKIEYLYIHHCCAIDELIVMLSYTPQLCRLSCTQIVDPNGDVAKTTFNTISSLTHVVIDRCLADFDEFEPFISNLSSQLEVLHLICSKDSAYLDVDRWERIISQHLLYLRIFEFKYEETIDEEFEETFYHEEIKQFNSLFWMKRKWFLNIDIDTDFWGDNIIIYSISQKKKNQINSNVSIENERIFNNSIDQNSIQQTITSSIMNSLNIIDYFCDFNDESFIDIIGPVLERINITCLNITREKIFIGALIDLIKYLPNLDTLIISTLTMIHPRCLSGEEVRTLRLVSNTNKITKVNLQRINELAEIHFLFDLCPHIEYLEIDCRNKILLKRFVRFILMKNIKYIPNLFLLSLKMPEINEKIIDKLKKMIDLEQLRQNYIIKKIDNRIYLRWN